MNVQSKRGVLTSLGLREGQIKGNSPPRANKSLAKREGEVEKEKVVISHYTHTQPGVATRPANPMTVQELNTTKYANSVGYTAHQKPQTHFTYAQGVHSNFVPPPPQRFLINSSHTVTQPSQLPVNSNSAQVHTVQVQQPPLVQSIRRTFVPHHIINEIPVVATQTKRVEVQRQQEQQGLNQADERMLQQYQKLYSNYVDQKTKNEHLMRQIRQYQLRINEQSSQPPQTRQTTKQVFIDKPKRIDIRILSSLIANKNKAVINDVVERRKQKCLDRVRQLIAQEQSALRTTMIRSSQEVVRVRTR